MTDLVNAERPLLPALEKHLFQHVGEEIGAFDAEAERRLDLQSRIRKAFNDMHILLNRPARAVRRSTIDKQKTTTFEMLRVEVEPITSNQ